MNEKVTTIILSVIAVFAVCLIGWGVITVSINSISTGDITMSNTTAAISNSGTMYNVLGIVAMMGAVLVIIGLLYYFASSQQRFNRLGKILEFLVNTASYFAYGLLAIVTVVVPSYLIYILYNYTVLDGHAGDVVPVLQWIGIIVIAFFSIAGLGYVFKKYIVDKYRKYMGKETKKDIKRLGA